MPDPLSSSSSKGAKDGRIFHEQNFLQRAAKVSSSGFTPHPLVVHSSPSGGSLSPSGGSLSPCCGSLQPSVRFTPPTLVGSLAPLRAVNTWCSELALCFTMGSVHYDVHYIIILVSFMFMLVYLCIIDRLLFSHICLKWKSGSKATGWISSDCPPVWASVSMHSNTGQKWLFIQALL